MFISLAILTSLASSEAEPCFSVSRKMNDEFTLSAVGISTSGGDIMYINPTVTAGSLSYPLGTVYSNGSSSGGYFTQFCEFLSEGKFEEFVTSQRAVNPLKTLLPDLERRIVSSDKEKVQSRLGADITINSVSVEGKTEGSSNVVVSLAYLYGVGHRSEVLQSVTCRKK